MRLAILNCKKRKQNYPCPASEMYSRNYAFRVMYTYVKRNYDAVAILSARYGLILDTEVIEPYDDVIDSLTEIEKEAWATRVLGNPLWSQYDEIDLHISRAYYTPIEGRVRANKITWSNNLTPYLLTN